MRDAGARPEYGYRVAALALCRAGDLALDCLVGDLVCHQACLPATAPGQALDDMLRERPELPGAIVVDGGRVVATIARQRWLEELSLPFRAELYLKHPLARALELFPGDWLAVGAAAPVHEAAEKALSRRRGALFDPIVVTGGDPPQLLDAHVLLLAQSRIFALSRERAEVLRREVEDTLADLRATQDNLVEARRLASLARLVAGMAHEINTPVGIALTAVSHMEDQTGPLLAAFRDNRLRRSDLERFLATTAEAASLARVNVQRAADLIRSFKRVAVDETSEARRKFKLGDYIGEVILSLRPLYKQRPCTVRVACADEIVFDSYPGALAQILSNLLSNAVEHAFPSGRPGQIEIACRQDGDEVELDFSDDGCGIPVAEQPHLFEPFFTTRGHAGGSGLGLHIVFNLVTKVLQGSIACTSEEGRGTRFALRLPRSPRP